MLVAYGVSSALTGLGREAFGMRQILTAMLAIVIGGGLLLQSIAALVGGWAVGGPEQVPAAWSVLASTAKGDFRVLWVGSHTNDPFPAPGGDPEGLAEAGDATLRYGLTGRDGTVAIDIARPSVGTGPDHLGEALDEILSGTTRHGGALLAPFGVRFVIAADDDVPSGAQRCSMRRSTSTSPAAGLVVYRNAQADPPAAACSTTILSIEAVLDGAVRRRPHVTALDPAHAGAGRLRRARAGTVFLSTEFQGAWQLKAPMTRRSRPSAGRPGSTPAGAGRRDTRAHCQPRSRRVARGRLGRRPLGDQKPVAR
jgi:hypothetical protein